MYLKRLEIQGFKTFAQKTVLEFLPPKSGSNALTVVVGPNGSGKSNIADAIRWCLGEQSMKQLRGKKTEDIIFSGSEGRSRSGFAEVTMIFDNEDKTMKTDFSEVAITRRLYRDGESDYLLNGNSTRHSDIQLLLAEAGVGQRSYAVIGQGMIDHVLTSSPEDRKTFFDDATGVRGLQIRRHQSLLKLEKSAVNLAEVQMLLDELEPRLNMLRRQVKKLEEREKVTAELKTVSLEYYRGKWAELETERRAITRRLDEMDVQVNAKRTELASGDKKLAEYELSETQKGGVSNPATGMGGLQDAYKRAQGTLAEARRAHVMAEREIELAKVRAQSSWSPLPLQDIVAEVKMLADSHESLLKKLKAVTTVEEIRVLEKEVEESLSRSRKLRDRLVKPNPEDFKVDPAALAEVHSKADAIKLAEAEVRRAEQAMDAKAKEASTAKSEIFAFQRTLRVLQTELMALEQSRGTIQIDMARIETKQDSLKQEAREGMGTDLDFSLNPLNNPQITHSITHLSELYERMLRLRRQVEMIGGIEESVVTEHAEVAERYTFLSEQVVDLRSAITSTEKIVDELDREIQAQSERALKEINHEFQKYFKVLFGGGSCSLMKVEVEAEDREGGVLNPAQEPVVDDMTSDLVTSRVRARREAVIGIDIQATPPGKRLKALNLLSGGERALTSIALLCAIMHTNPSPFVVLDEVDAALDEANTVRFANILNELRERTQFIVITHNRATMEKGDTLYGVSMGGDGVSKMLSVKIEDVGVNRHFPVGKKSISLLELDHN